MAKVMLADLETDVKDQSGWLEKARTRHEAIRAHVVEEEQKFPRLTERLGEKNQQITADFRREFDRVDQNA